MPGLRLPLLSLVCCLLVASPAYSQSSSVGTKLPSRRVLNRHGLKQAWWNQATMDFSRDKLRHLTIDEELTYVQSSGGIVTVFDSANGKRLWAAQLGPRDTPSYPVVSNGEVVMVAVGLEMYALKKWTGELIWRLNLPGAISTSPSTDENQIYVGGFDGTIYAFDLRKIRELYQESLLPQWSHLTLKWRYKTSKTVTTPPISTGRVVNFASRDGSLYSVSADERDLSFQFETDAPVSAPLAQSEGFLYMASEGFNLYCININNGAVRWEFTAGLPIRKAPRVVGSQVFLTPQRGGMYCLTAASGRQLWWRPHITQFLAATPTTVYASDQEGNLVLLSRENGAIQGALPFRHFQVRLANDRTDRVFLATEKGLIVCLHEQGREFPLFQMYPDRRPILPGFAPEPGGNNGEPKNGSTSDDNQN